VAEVTFGVVAKLRDAPLSRSRSIALGMSSASRAALVIWVLQPFISVIFVVVAKLLVEALSLVFGFAGVVGVIFGVVAELLDAPPLRSLCLQLLVRRWSSGSFCLTSL
jgi:hypothetical protein